MIFLRNVNNQFLKPRKVGGTSFEIAVSRFAGPGDPVSPEDKATRTAMGCPERGIRPDSYDKLVSRYFWAPRDRDTGRLPGSGS